MAIITLPGLLPLSHHKNSFHFEVLWSRENKKSGQSFMPFLKRVKDASDLARA